MSIKEVTELICDNRAVAMHAMHVHSVAQLLTLEPAMESAAPAPPKSLSQLQSMVDSCVISRRDAVVHQSRAAELLATTMISMCRQASPFNNGHSQC